ncbi:hypothetical protein [uncultured Campylobacter sp.]|uniref:hypothetical protein n=1 Tax=uncultured Campylobacter sp. TaxID=218934 RepID=UPI002618A5EB|nr:hypothetical protein [uncultured Campylobacter sp.]
MFLRGFLNLAHFAYAPFAQVFAWIFLLKFHSCEPFAADDIRASFKLSRKSR